MPSARTTFRAAVALLAAASGIGLAAVPAAAGPATVPAIPDGPALARQLVRKVDVANTNRHLIALQRFADRNGGTRAAGTPGYGQSAEYFATKLAAAGYTVDRQEFPFVFDQTRGQSLTVGGTSIAVQRMRYSESTPAGGVTTTLSVLPNDPTPGCEASDYAGAVGKIALVTRGVCSFATKTVAAAQAGALAVLVYNNVPLFSLVGTLVQPVPGSAPAGGLTQAEGAQLATQDGAPVTIDLQGFMEERTSYNVIAETKTGRHDNVVVAGAHLDSVTDGPGINDNGTGSAALLEIALQLGGSPKVGNAVRFAFWSAEELSQIGSNFYLQGLDFEEQLNIALYLNFDLIGSPNAGYFTFDGDDSAFSGAGPGPYGSGQIERAFTDYFDHTGIPLESRDLEATFDYNAFVANGIPVGGLFTGADGLKTEAQADKWGGVAGQPFDICFHMICDNLGNVDRVALDRNSDAIAFVLGSYAISTEDINGVPPRAQRAKARAAATKSVRPAPAAHEGVAA
jgi:Zn-dependent M28 family amino/carboxypeptidase